MGELIPFPISRCVGFLREGVESAMATRDPLRAIDATVSRYERRLSLMGVEPERARHRVESTFPLSPQRNARTGS